MKVVAVKRIIGKGALGPSHEWSELREQVKSAIEAVDWPEGSGSFTIHPKKHGNGVKAIQQRAAKLLDDGGWRPQVAWPIDDTARPGRIDAAFSSSAGLVAFEWETGNISSSHRSLNKMCLGLNMGAIAGGFMAVSSNRLAPYLTDRIGNIGELERYFPLWAATPCSHGVLEILVVEQDEESLEAPLIPKGTDGRALR